MCSYHMFYMRTMGRGGLGHRQWEWCRQRGQRGWQWWCSVGGVGIVGGRLAERDRDERRWGQKGDGEGKRDGDNIPPQPKYEVAMWLTLHNEHTRLKYSTGSIILETSLYMYWFYNELLGASWRCTNIFLLSFSSFYGAISLMFLYIQTFSAILAPSPMTTKSGKMQPHTYMLRMWAHNDWCSACCRILKLRLIYYRIIYDIKLHVIQYRYFCYIQKCECFAWNNMRDLQKQHIVTYKNIWSSKNI